MTNNNVLLILLRILFYGILIFLTNFAEAFKREDPVWTARNYPDIRQHIYHDQAEHSCGRYEFLCDPDGILTKDQGQRLNKMLVDLAKTTPCHCMRNSQCRTNDVNGRPFEVGFVVGIAMVKMLQTTSENPQAQEIAEAAERFANSVHSSWALGDCRNSALILFWGRYKKIHVSLTSTTMDYLTQEEANGIVDAVQKHFNLDNYMQGFDEMLVKMKIELSGEPVSHVDTGTLSLIISVAVASALVVIISGCVCAFRCCGNLNPLPDTPLGQAIQRVDNIKAEVIRRGSMIRRSFSKSPKFPRRPPGVGGGIDPALEEPLNDPEQGMSIV